MRVRDALIEPFHLEDVLLELEASIGDRGLPRRTAPTSSTLMRRADVAMYLAKEQRTGVEVYDPARDRNSTDRLGLLAALRRALDAGELELHYQPKVTLGTGSTSGRRWSASRRWCAGTTRSAASIPPDEFIPLAETSGLMHRLTDYVIDTRARAGRRVALRRACRSRSP